MKVLSLFDGMSCGMIALERAGIKVDTYYASEIDKYAIEISKKNYPQIVQVGDVCDLDPNDFKDVDLIMGGSPCQGFSFAGKGLAFDDPRSALFFEFVRLLKAIKPKYFLLENVRMKKEYLQVITDLLGVEPIFIDSALVTGQTRKRYYWTNIPGIVEPKDKNILLKDVIETKVHERYIAKPHKEYKGGDQLNPTYRSQANTIYKIEGKSPTLCAGTHGYAMGYIEVPQYVDKDKSFCIDAHYGQGGNLKRYFERGSRQLVFMDKTFRTYRKLTPLECERLQTVPDNYTEGVSNTQRYKMLGNGWTVDVIAHIFNNIDDRFKQSL